MTAIELQKYVYDRIPIVERNALEIVSANKDEVVVGGRFVDHVNHHNSVFGGSISTAATLAAWALVSMIINDVQQGAIVVVQRQSVRFHVPIVKDFVAVATSPEKTDIDRFISSYERLGRARLSVQVGIRHVGEPESENSTRPRAEYSGEFVVMRP